MPGMKDRECNSIVGLDEVDQTSFNGNIVCGSRGAEPYATATRVDPGTTKCPESTNPCSSSTSPENTICTNSAYDCPITDIKFIKAAETLPDGYQKKTWDTDWLLIYTTDGSDSLPVASTNFVGTAPCLNPMGASQL